MGDTTATGSLSGLRHHGSGAGPGPHAHASASVRVRGLTVAHGDAVVLDGLDLDLVPGTTHVVLGASGAGKSTVVAALTGTLPRGARVEGVAVLETDGTAVDLLRVPRRVRRRRLAGRVVGTAPQGAGGAFTPTMTVGAHLREVQRVAGRGRPRLGVAHPHLGTSPRQQLVELAHAAGVEPAWLRRHPHELSGGQLSRLGLVAAMVDHPPVLLADEPTAGLDAEATRTVGALLAAYAAAGHTVLVITHDDAFARQIAHVVTRVARGRVVAQGAPEDVLVDTAPALRPVRTVAADAPALVASAITARRGGRPVLAPTDLAVRRGEVVGLTGPSGVGKSTLAALLARLDPPDGGQVALPGVAGAPRAGFDLPPTERRRVGWVSQHPHLAVDPRLTLRRTIELPTRLAAPGTDVAARVTALAQRLGLGTALLDRRPHEVSGGELQRACVARALALAPEFLVLDEVTSMLDARTATDVLHVVADEATAGAGVLLVGHDVAACVPCATACSRCARAPTAPSCARCTTTTPGSAPVRRQPSAGSRRSRRDAGRPRCGAPRATTQHAGHTRKAPSPPCT
ncbi:ABC transporter ATP-binding protein [Cellulosimicrobium sp. CUA-896]|uniref:ABC transporter ATP-binding protein n=1 Tax=Cellulosimicrobium sp. CUA-896 TaxID=1517881 RepID=UPI0009596B96|nr:ATP-binding cassette domain-containing protein [Cellulosimicrobium sp. CUA-896]OLT48060.1 sugar-transporting ATPase [Cellulosimicrobium sp. CUA-896]